MQPIFKRILLKLSGEGLAGADGSGINNTVLSRLAREVAEVKRAGVQVCLVIGGGNFYRGANGADFLDRNVSDQMGMLATVMNALAMKSALEALKCPATVFSGLRVPQVCEDYSFRKAMAALEQEHVVIFAGGTGSPYFTTDTGAALRAVEMHCDILMKATQVDGVYSADPKKDKNARRFDKISFAEVREKKLRVMDITAVAMAEENNLPVMIFNLQRENAVIGAVCGKIENTTIS